MKREREMWHKPGDLLRRESDEMLREDRAHYVCTLCGQRGCADTHRDMRREE